MDAVAGVDQAGAVDVVDVIDDLVEGEQGLGREEDRGGGCVARDGVTHRTGAGGLGVVDDAAGVDVALLEGVAAGARGRGTGRQRGRYAGDRTDQRVVDLDASEGDLGVVGDGELVVHDVADVVAVVAVGVDDQAGDLLDQTEAPGGHRGGSRAGTVVARRARLLPGGQRGGVVETGASAAARCGAGGAAVVEGDVDGVRVRGIAGDRCAGTSQREGSRSVARTGGRRLPGARGGGPAGAVDDELGRELRGVDQRTVGRRAAGVGDGDLVAGGVVARRRRARRADVGLADVEGVGSLRVGDGAHDVLVGQESSRAGPGPGSTRRHGDGGVAVGAIDAGDRGVVVGQRAGRPGRHLVGDRERGVLVEVGGGDRRAGVGAGRRRRVRARLHRRSGRGDRELVAGIATTVDLLDDGELGSTGDADLVVLDLAGQRQAGGSEGVGRSDHPESQDRRRGARGQRAGDRPREPPAAGGERVGLLAGLEGAIGVEVEPRRHLAGALEGHVLGKRVGRTGFEDQCGRRSRGLAQAQRVLVGVRPEQRVAGDVVAARVCAHRRGDLRVDGVTQTLGRLRDVGEIEVGEQRLPAVGASLGGRQSGGGVHRSSGEVVLQRGGGRTVAGRRVTEVDLERDTESDGAVAATLDDDVLGRRGVLHEGDGTRCGPQVGCAGGLTGVGRRAVELQPVGRRAAPRGGLDGALRAADPVDDPPGDRVGTGRDRRGPDVLLHAGGLGVGHHQTGEVEGLPRQGRRAVEVEDGGAGVVDVGETGDELVGAVGPADVVEVVEAVGPPRARLVRVQDVAADVADRAGRAQRLPGDHRVDGLGESGAGLDPVVGVTPRHPLDHRLEPAGSPSGHGSRCWGWDDNLRAQSHDQARHDEAQDQSRTTQRTHSTTPK